MQIIHVHVCVLCKKKSPLPKYGTFFVLAQLAARIFPSVPRIPKPPGTSIPLLTKKKKTSNDHKLFPCNLSMSSTCKYHLDSAPCV